MTSSSVRVALVTGATQGLGRALVEGLARRLGPDDVVYVTGRRRPAVDAVADRLGGLPATVRGELFDVGQPSAAAELAETIRQRHGGLDIVFGNAVMRIDPGDDYRAVIGEYVEVNNLGTTRLLRSFLPLLRDGGRLIVVASSLGTLNHLPPVLHPRFDGLESLDAVDAAVLAWRDQVADGSVRASSWPTFINIPSKIGQVAAVRAVAAPYRERGVLVAAACPGMMNTPTSQAWWDVSAAPAPEQAAVPLLEMALGPVKPGFSGELVRAGAVLPWKP
jgi:NAD(P)-dependent dehydrogenase (short-subunit alcohol dehydrogenase family)